MVGVDSNADGRSDEQFVSVDQERCRSSFENFLGNFAMRARACHVGQHHHKLVTTQARHHVGLSYRKLQSTRQLLQQKVARRMPERVVHKLEAVQIQEHHAHMRLRASCARQHLLGFHMQKRPIGQTSERIVERERAHLLFCLAALCNVAPVTDHTANAWISQRIRKQRLNRAPLAALGTKAKLNTLRAAGHGHSLCKNSLHLCQIIGVHIVESRAGQQILSLVTKMALQARTNISKAACCAHDGQDIRRALQK